MTPQQALQILLQALVTKPGLTIEEIAAVVSAWTTLERVVRAPQSPAPQEKSE